MKIVDVFCSPGRTGFYFDDQRAIKMGAVPDGASYTGKVATPGFTAVRQAGEAVSVMLLLEDGQIAWGDCAAVQYSGAGGRDPLFLAGNFIPIIDRYVKPALVGQTITTFRKMASDIEAIDVEGVRLHTAVRYGVSQALLDAVARSECKMMCEVISHEYGTMLCTKMIPIFTQSGDNRYENVDKMIIKGAAVLPHGLINHVETKLGKRGELLEDYISWLSMRVKKLRTEPDYEPVLHLDVYGNMGLVFGNEAYSDIADYLARLEKAASPFKLRIEGPIDVEERERQMIALKELTALVDRRGIGVEIVADEWCNTLDDIKYFANNRAGHMVQIKTPDLGGVDNTAEAVIYCKERGIGAYLGGTCNETDRSAQVCVHLAMATNPDQVLAKPGMGVDEGYMIVYNEMQRILTIAKRR